MKASLHERRIEVVDIDTKGIHFMVHDGEYNSAHVLLDAEDARSLAAELLESADELDGWLMSESESKRNGWPVAK